MKHLYLLNLLVFALLVHTNSDAQCQVSSDTSVFGNNVWNVYAFNAGDANGGSGAWVSEYKGYYVDTALQFDTRNKWAANTSPSSASGYQGCTVNNDNHSWSAKRKGFPCGQYTINIPGHDDAAQLLVNSIKVWEHIGCGKVHDNVWKGYLDYNSTIEFRVSEGSIFIKTCGVMSGGYVTNKKDCNDADATVHPGAVDICDGKDNDCNGLIDEDCRHITITDASVTEGNQSQRNMSFTVKLNRTSTQALTVNFTTQDNTANAGSDYFAQSGTISLLPGINSAKINIVF